MRKISPVLQERLNNPIQAQATKSDPRLDAWVLRPFTAITDPLYLEIQEIPYQISDVSGNSRNVDIAVRHSHLYRQSSEIFVAYIENGNKLKIKSTDFKESIDDHVWKIWSFSPQADDVALCFNAHTEKTLVGREEFITDRYPWVFWTYGGALYGRLLSSSKVDELETITLASANTHRVTAIRASKSLANAFDFGLIVFFITNGQIYYRQLIDGVWYDAELVTINGLEQITFVDITAERTWDYRIVIQAKANNGNIYEIYSQFGGIGTRASEHIDIKNLTALGTLNYLEGKSISTAEHININNLKGSSPFGGLYQIGTAKLVNAKNVPDDVGDYGKDAVFVFDRHLNPESVTRNFAQFSIIDERGYIYTPTSATVLRDGYSLLLSFPDFNNAQSECQAAYVPGTVTTMTGEAVEKSEVKFTPVNLNPNGIEAPVPVEAWDEGGNGTVIYLRFNSDIISELAGNENKITINFDAYDYVPGGKILKISRSIKDISFVDNDHRTVIKMTLSEGNQNTYQNAIGNITISYAGGTLRGNGDPVQRFDFTFIPESLYYKEDQNDAEHIIISEFSAIGNLLKVNYKEAAHPSEHINIFNISASGNLLSVNDI